MWKSYQNLSDRRNATEKFPRNKCFVRFYHALSMRAARKNDFIRIRSFAFFPLQESVHNNTTAKSMRCRKRNQ